MTSLYDTIGVAPSATKAEIQAAFRRRAKHAHPDAGGDAADFHALSRAKLVLLDDDRRARYDATGEEDDQPDNTGAEVLQMAVQFIQAAVQSIAQHGMDPEGVDIIEYARRDIAAQMRACDGSVRKAEAALEKAKAFAVRFTGKDGGPNRLGQAFESEAATISRGIETAKAVRAKLTSAMKLLEAHSFDVKPPPAPPEVVPSFFTYTSTMGV